MKLKVSLLVNFPFLVIILLLLTIFYGCNSGDGDGRYCPPTPNDGQYIFCVNAHEFSKDNTKLAGSTPNGSYMPGTLVTAFAQNEYSNASFSGWYDDPEKGRKVSGENPYSFILIEDTRLYAGYCYHGYVGNSCPPAKEDEIGPFPDPPTINSVEPDLVLNESPFEINITGSGFEPTPKAAIYGGGLFVKGSNKNVVGQDIQVIGDYAYIVGFKGFWVVDVSDPGNPTPVWYNNQSDHDPSPWGLHVSGNYFYSVYPYGGGANEPGGLRIFDVSDPSSPLPVAYIETQGEARGVFVSGNYAYVSVSRFGFEVIDVSDPNYPFRAGFWEDPDEEESFNGIFVSDNHAYVMGNRSGLMIFDITNPAQPLHMGTFSESKARNVYVSGNHAYVGGLYIVDVSDPSNPVESASIGIGANDVWVEDNYVYAACSKGLQIYDVSDPENPSYVGAGYAQVSNLTVVGDYAYMIGSEGLSIIELDEPVNPSIVSRYISDHPISKVCISGNIAYVAGEWLDVIDIADPINPTLIASSEILNEWTHLFVEDIHLLDDRVYIADSVDGIYVIDVSSLKSPTLINQITTPGSAHGIHVKNGYAFVADGSGLQVFDLSDSSIAGCLQTPGAAIGIDIYSDNAYIASGYQGLIVVNISDPKNPIFMGNCRTSGYANKVNVRGNYAYVSDTVSRFYVIDISDPYFPHISGSIYIGGEISDIHVSEPFVYLSGSPGITVVDISDAENPVVVGVVDTPGAATGISVSGDNAYVADGRDGLLIANTIKPANPVSFISAGQINATVTNKLTSGTYNVNITNPDGGRGILHNAIRIESGTN